MVEDLQRIGVPPTPARPVAGHPEIRIPKVKPERHDRNGEFPNFADGTGSPKYCGDASEDVASDGSAPAPTWLKSCPHWPTLRLRAARFHDGANSAST